MQLFVGTRSRDTHVYGACFSRKLVFFLGLRCRDKWAEPPSGPSVKFVDRERCQWSRRHALVVSSVVNYYCAMCCCGFRCCRTETWSSSVSPTIEDGRTQITLPTTPFSLRKSPAKLQRMCKCPAVSAKLMLNGFMNNFATPSFRLCQLCCC